MTFKLVPKHEGWPILKNVVPFLRDLFYYPQTLKDQLGPIFQMAIPGYNPIFVFDPDAIHHVLTKNNQNYKKSKDYDTLKLTLGQGLLTNEGDSWKRVRKELQPYFFENVVTQFMGIMFEHSQALVTSWTQETDVISVNAQMKHLTLKIGSDAFFGKDLSALRVDIPGVVDQLNAIGVKKMRLPRNQIPYSWPTPLHLKMRALIKQLDDQLYELMNASDDDTYHLLSLLVNNPKLSPKQVRDELVTFLIAGYETTANTMMFTIALLVNHPDIQSELRDEVRSNALNPDDYKNWPKTFPLLYACLKESMRLYPPAWMIGRSSIDDDELGGFFIPKGSNVLIDLFLLHRQEAFFEGPERFNPYRFINSSIEKNAYLPFGGGPRVCIGQHFAMLEMVTILHHILSEFRLDSVQSEIVCDPLVTLTPKNPILIKAIRSHI